MNSFPTFFRYDEEAHFRSLIVSPYTLYDTHRGTITIKSPIEELESNLAEPIRQEHLLVRAAVKKVACLRHNVIAHRNATLSYDGIFEQAALKPDDLKQLISDSLALLATIAGAIGARKPALSPFPASEAARLLERLKSG